MQDVTPEQAHWSPPGIANPLGASYVHTITGEDAVLNGKARSAPPLFATSWAGKLGLSEMVPGPGAPWDAWARSVKVDLPQAREYAQAVYKSTDEYLASLSAKDLEKPVDLSGFGMGQQPLSFLVGGILLQHVNSHLGEISCLKGIQGAKGYPF